MSVTDPGTIERARQLTEIINEYIRTMTPQERDRTMQMHLAQARGPARNGDLLRTAVDRMARMLVAQGKRHERPVMDDILIETLKATADALEAERVVYAVTGSIASSVHGEPFMSEDVDLIVQASVDQARSLSGRLTPRFYAPQDMLVQAARELSLTNVVDNRTGLKADLSFIPQTGYLADALARRVRLRIGTAAPGFWFVTPEDVILMKLLWRKDSRSQKQWENALSVARIKGARMDWRYLLEQARQLDIEDDLIRLRDEAGI